MYVLEANSLSAYWSAQIGRLVVFFNIQKRDMVTHLTLCKPNNDDRVIYIPYTPILSSKTWVWGMHIHVIFILIFAQNRDCGYTLEPPQWGGSNEYPQSMF